MLEVFYKKGAPKNFAKFMFNKIFAIKLTWLLMASNNSYELDSKIFS